MRIGLNLLHARKEIGGTWNYMANVARALTLMDSDWRFIAYCTKISAEMVPDDPKFEIKIGDGEHWRCWIAAIRCMR